MAASALLAQLVYDVTANVIIDSAVRAITGWDIMTSIMKSWVFGVIIAVVRMSPCSAIDGQLLQAANCCLLIVWPYTGTLQQLCMSSLIRRLLTHALMLFTNALCR